MPFKQTAVCALQAYGCGQAWTAASTHTLYTPNVPAPGEVAKRNAVIMTGLAGAVALPILRKEKSRGQKKRVVPLLNTWQIRSGNEQTVLTTAEL